MLEQIAESYGLDISKAHSPKSKLKLLVQKLALKNTVVLLIDEYDKPILDHLHNDKKADAHRLVLKNFYDGFKGLDAYMRAIFITGLSKFSRTSIFSGLNNLNEISYEPQGAQLAGYTESELIEAFSGYIQTIAQEQKISVEETIEKIRYWYNGYQFSQEPIKMYNPFSILYLCEKKKFRNYWFETGTPTFLIGLLKQHANELKSIESKAFSSSSLGTFRLDQIPLDTLLFQTGYLTIKEYDEQFDMYKLGFPNEEIKQSLSLLRMGIITHQEASQAENHIYQIKHALESKDIETFITTVRSLIASIPYNLHVKNEAYYHSLFKLLCNVLDSSMLCEVAISTEKIDLVIERPKYIYIIELKFNKPAAQALDQILKKRYYEPFLASAKEIILLEISFNFKNKKLEVDWALTEPPR